MISNAKDTRFLVVLIDNQQIREAGAVGLLYDVLEVKATSIQQRGVGNDLLELLAELVSSLSTMRGMSQHTVAVDGKQPTKTKIIILPSWACIQESRLNNLVWDYQEGNPRYFLSIHEEIPF